jgi:hypothetical protein
MTRHAAYSLRAGKRTRYPFATFPHADAARRWLEAHPDDAVSFVPALPDPDPQPNLAAFRPREDDTLGACGCRDYHSADCPLRTGGTGRTADDWYAVLSRRDPDDVYGDDV